MACSPATTEPAPPKPAAAPPRRTTGPFLVVAAALWSLIAGANLPTPLYAVYRERFGFSATVLTLVFTTYAIVLVGALIVCGQLSDRLGRRRVIAAGLGVAMVALGLFALARGTPWLFAARACQGLAAGTVSGAAVAALVELEPSGDGGRAALVATLAQAGGTATGPIVAGVLAEWAPAQRVLCYLVWLGLTGAIAIAVLGIREPARATGRWRLQRPSVPPAIRRPFAWAGVTAAAAWAVAALFVSVVPSYAAKLLDSDDLALLGAIAATMLATSCATQWLASGRVSRGAQPAGLAVLAGGLLALVVAFPLHSLAIVLAAALLAGSGHGLAFLGAQTELNHIAPSDRRGEVTAAFMSCIYGGVAVSVIGVGVISTSAQSLYTAVAIFAAAIGATAVLTAGWHLTATRALSPP
jgi:predicted MFS family arabinose efflux permease